MGNLAKDRDLKMAVWFLSESANDDRKRVKLRGSESFSPKVIYDDPISIPDAKLMTQLRADGLGRVVHRQLTVWFRQHMKFLQLTLAPTWQRQMRSTERTANHGCFRCLRKCYFTPIPMFNIIYAFVLILTTRFDLMNTFDSSDS